MPEGHVTHRLATAYQGSYGGRPIHASSPQGRFAASAALIDGRPLDHAEAVGKHLFLHFGPDIVHVHLGMAGKVFDHRVADFAAAPPVGQRPVALAVRLRLEDEQGWTDLVGPAACDLISAEQRDAIVARIGPDPLDPVADPTPAWERVHRSKHPIAALLMDQRVTAGVGNIFRAESLYRAGMDPMLPGIAVTRKEFDALWADLVTLMTYAVEHGRIDTVHPEHEPAVMGREPRVDRHGGEVYVYRRAGMPCHVCQTPIKTTVLAGRNLFWCPRCQPLSRRAAAVVARRTAAATAGSVGGRG